MINYHKEYNQNIQVYSNNNLPPEVNIVLFIQELKKELEFKQSTKIFFIGYPKINNIINTQIDLLLIIAIESKDKNFYTVDNNTQGKMYFNNLIIPIRFLNEYQGYNISFPAFNGENTRTVKNIIIQNNMQDDDIEFEVESEISELKKQTKGYLEKIWQKEVIEIKNKAGNSIQFFVTPHPIFWIISGNKNYDFNYENIIYAPKFGFEELKAYLRYSYFHTDSFSSVYHWSKRNDKQSYLLIDKHIELLEEQLKKDNKLGKLTKKKIDRLYQQYQEDLKLYENYLIEKEQNQNYSTQDDESIFNLVFGNEQPKSKAIKITLTARIEAEKGLNQNLIIISGKAGSGKTFEMLLLMKKNYLQQKNSYYLTYNKALTYDVRVITQQFGNEKRTAIKTIHKFMFDIVNDGLIILRILTNKRLQELEQIQEKRYQICYSILTKYVEESSLNELSSTDFIKSHFGFYHKDLREYYLLFISYIKKEIKEKNTIIKKQYLLNKLAQYKNRNVDFTLSKLKNQYFLSDYYQILRYILLAVKGEIEQLYEELEIDLLSDEEWEKIIKDKQTKYTKDISSFRKLINRSIGGVKAKGQILFIDEGQDCHPLERDIFLTIWEERNIVICTGGEEQLIRHSEECDWEYNESNKKKLHNIIKVEKRSKTYRMKPNLVKLANFLAKKYQVNLDLTAHIMGASDLGNVILEFNDPNYKNLSAIFNQLKEKEKDNQLSSYESILFLCESSAKHLYQKEQIEESLTIDDNNNVHISEATKDSQSKIRDLLEIEREKLFFHNQIDYEKNNKEKDDEEIPNKKYKDDSPTANTYRCLFYESCRGLEAWSTVCLDLDLFYLRKYSEDDAGCYLSNDLLLDENERREKYAITWVLMALTRAIDTIFIHLNMQDIKDDPSNPRFTQEDIDSLNKFRQILLEYSELTSQI